MGLSVRASEGVLSGTTFPALFYSILSDQDTGVLTLSREPVEKSVYIQHGRPVFATSTDRDDRLDEIFIKAGRVAVENLLAAGEESRSQGYYD